MVRFGAVAVWCGMVWCGVVGWLAGGVVDWCDVVWCGFWAGVVGWQADAEGSSKRILQITNRMAGLQHRQQMVGACMSFLHCN